MLYYYWLPRGSPIGKALRSMKTVRDIMTADAIWLSASSVIKTAIILMKKRGVPGLPILDGEKIVGVLDYGDILGKDTDIPVQHLMSKEFMTVPPDMPVKDAADQMVRLGSDWLPVVEDDTFAGIITLADLIPALGKSLDTLTGLPRADAMRDWGISALKDGKEITVIFVDLDQLRQFNKQYGHVIGDNAIKHVAAVLQSCVDDGTDMLCRYAGDEFVIVSTREGAEARALAQLAFERIRDTHDPQLPEPVTGAVGVHGGKRTKEREDVHYAATLDSLINLASKACTLAKAQPEPALLNGGAIPAVEKPQEPAVLPIPPDEASITDTNKRLKILGLNLSWDSGSTATVEIELSDGTRTFKHSRSGFALGNSALRLVADATGEAITGFLPSPGYGVTAESVQTANNGAETIVLIAAFLVTPQRQIRLSGSSIVKQDAYKATAAAFLNAVNRQVSTLI